MPQSGRGIKMQTDKFSVLEICGEQYLYTDYRNRDFINAATTHELNLYYLRHGDDDWLDGASIEKNVVVVNLHGLLIGRGEIEDGSFLEDEENPQDGELKYFRLDGEYTLKDFLHQCIGINL